MQLICPSCQKSIVVPDSEAGKSITCNQCGHSFSAPQMYAMSSVESSPPPLPPQANSAVAPSPAADRVHSASPADTSTTSKASSATTSATAAPLISEGYSRFRSVLLNRNICHWLVPVCFTLIFLLSFFKWDGFYPAGHAAYTQNAWQAMVGSMSVDPVAEKVFQKEKDLSETLRASLWLLPYLILVIVGLALAWVVSFVKSMNLRLPAILENMMDHRPTILMGCAALTLLILLIQTAVGFGLQNAMQERLPEELVEEQKAAKTPEENQKIEMKIAREHGQYGPVQTTFVLKFVVFLHILALIGIMGETMLIRRGQRPPPRLGVMW